MVLDFVCLHSFEAKIKSSMDELNKIAQKIGSEIYKQQGGQGQPPGGGPSGDSTDTGAGKETGDTGKTSESEEKVVDAEVVEDDDKSKK